MRSLADEDRIRRFMHALGSSATDTARVYLTGGASAVLLGWRGSTLDVDLKIVPDRDDLLRAIPRLKDELQLNVELASPMDFIPVPPGWEERSPFILQEGRVFFHHFDFYAQALSKVERRHAQDVQDVTEMLRRDLIAADRARDYFERIEPELYRYPALSPSHFRAAVLEAFGQSDQERL